MGKYTQEQIDAGKARAEDQFALTKDQSGYDSAMSFWNSQVPTEEPGAEATEAVEESPKEEDAGPSFSAAAERLIESSGLSKEDFAGYERVTLPVVEAKLADLAPEPESEAPDDAPAVEEPAVDDDDPDMPLGEGTDDDEWPLSS
jgi:hypothetical protein